MNYPQFFKKFAFFLKNKIYAIVSLGLFFLFEKAQATTISIQNPLNVDSIEGLLQQIINYFLTFLAAPLMIIVLIIAGIRYATAGANQKRADDAKKMIKWALIGIVFIVGSLAIVNTVVSLLAGRQ